MNEHDFLKVQPGLKPEPEQVETVGDFNKRLVESIDDVAAYRMMGRITGINNSWLQDHDIDPRPGYDPNF